MEGFYSKDYFIEDYMCDRNKNLLPSFALKLVQSVSVLHCENMGVYEKISARGQAFLITKQLCEFSRPIKSGETVTLFSAPTEISRGIFPRITYFCNENGEKIGYCDARWFLFDTNSRRPLRKFDSDIEYRHVTGISHERIVFPQSEMEFLKTESVRYCQIDTNGHLNNTEYLNYLSDVTKDSFIHKFQVSYKKEIISGDIRLEIAKTDNTIHLAGYNGEDKNFEIFAEI
ncbi:MAG: thioesterase [Bacillota bacterium]